MMDEEEVWTTQERYVALEAELQALRQRNKELMRGLQEQWEIVAAERLRVDRRSRAQTQQFANLTEELLVGRRGPEVQLGGMRLSIKVEKPENYDGSKGRDLDTWIFQAREHLDLTVIPEWGHVPYATPLLWGNVVLWWHELTKVGTAQRLGMTFALFCMSNSGQKIIVATVEMNWPHYTNIVENPL